MYSLIKNTKFDLYFKSNGKFILANNNTVKEFMQSHTNKKSKKRKSTKKRKSKKSRKKSRKLGMGRFPHKKSRNKRR